MAGDRNRLAEKHADRASEILADYDQAVLDYVRAPREGMPDREWEAKFAALQRLGARRATLAQAHALTALALRKVGGR